MNITELNTLTAYKRYSKESENIVDLALYRKIVNSYMKFITAKIISGEDVTLPGRMGSVSIIGRKKKIEFPEKGNLRLPPNWSATKKLWDRNPKAKEEKKIVYCLNEETSGVIYKFLWSKERVAIEDKFFYTLIMTRTNKREVYKSIKQGKEYLIKN